MHACKQILCLFRCFACLVLSSCTCICWVGPEKIVTVRNRENLEAGQSQESQDGSQRKDRSETRCCDVRFHFLDGTTIGNRLNNAGYHIEIYKLEDLDFAHDIAFKSSTHYNKADSYFASNRSQNK